MLVLTRQNREEIVIAGKIRLQILDTQGGRVRIGVSASREVSVVREEIQEQRAKPPAANPVR
jgi:carbon storage regulator